MELERLLKDTTVRVISGKDQQALEVRDICMDSRQVREGSLFMALPGTKVHGCQFVSSALDQGAVALLVPEDCINQVMPLVPRDVVVLTAPDIKRGAGELVSNFYGHPSSKLKVIGITGTNGKTTCSYLVESILNMAGRTTALSGTICQRIKGHCHGSTLTTPDLISFHRFLKEALDNGVEYVIAEVSSHALDQGRVMGCRFEAALFTNLSHDHLDYHQDMEAYFEAKSRLFHQYEPARSIINLDDSFGRRLFSSIKGHRLSYGMTSQADIYPSWYRLGREGLELKICLNGDGETELLIESPLIGRHNLYNILASVAVAHALGIGREAIKDGIEALKVIPGRLEPVKARGVLGLVDYAHTPDAIAKVLEALGNIKGQGRIITVVGCGGDRDQEKRPQMAKEAARGSDIAVFTSDNPRSEPPSRIIDQMLTGITAELKGRVRVIEDRAEAISWACSQAEAGDIVLVAGKGHEDYQIIGGKRISFDDRQYLVKALKEGVSDHDSKGYLQAARASIPPAGPTLANVARATGGEIIPEFKSVSFSAVNTDTRRISPGELFWALRGERFDGNLFLEDALKKGAVAAVAEIGPRKGLRGFPVVKVEDSQFALGEFASWYRRFIALRTLGITGSCGKTTTKELINSVLSRSYRTGATMGNMNNLIGLPLTILAQAPDIQWVVLEMGTNMPGEIGRLCQIARPEIGLVTCIRPVHLEGLGDLEGVAREKGALFEALGPDGTALVNVDEPLVVQEVASRLNTGRIVAYGTREQIAQGLGADVFVRLKQWSQGPKGLKVEVELDKGCLYIESRLFGRVNLPNILAAVAAGVALDIEPAGIKEGIEAVSAQGGRMNVEEVPQGWIIVDDSYNANPSSVEGALEFVGDFYKGMKKNVVLGDMLELGERAEEFHLAVGEKVAEISPSVLVTVGSMARLIAEGAKGRGFPKERIFSFDSSGQAAQYLLKEEGSFFNGTQRVVLLKGSRGVHLEEITSAIKQRLAGEGS